MLPGGLPKLSGVVCAYHPAVPGSNPFSIYSPILYLKTVLWKGRNEQKEAGNGLFKNMFSSFYLYLFRLVNYINILYLNNIEFSGTMVRKRFCKNAII